MSTVDDDEEDLPAMNEQQYLEKCNDSIRRKLLEASSSEDEDEIDQTPTTTNIEDHLKNSSDYDVSDEDDEDHDDDASSSGRGTASLSNSNVTEGSITASPPEDANKSVAVDISTASSTATPSESSTSSKSLSVTTNDSGTASNSNALQAGMERVKFNKTLFDLSALSEDSSDSDPELKTIPSPKKAITKRIAVSSDSLDLSMLPKRPKDKSIPAYLNRSNEKSATPPATSVSTTTPTTANASESGCISVSSDSELEEEVVTTRRGEGEPEEEAVRRGPIRRFITKDQLASETKVAQRAENERIKRLDKKQEKLTRRLASQPKDADGKQVQVLLDYDSKRKMNIVIHQEVVKLLKEHQIEGVKFMYDACYGSVDDIDKYDGSGCILAHCMGLGKTLQLIALLHTVTRYPQLKTKKVLVICPKSTVMNWGDEIKRWLGPIKNCIRLKVFTFSDHW